MANDERDDEILKLRKEVASRWKGIKQRDDHFRDVVGELTSRLEEIEEATEELSEVLDDLDSLDVRSEVAAARAVLFRIAERAHLPTLAEEWDEDAG